MFDVIITNDQEFEYQNAGEFALFNYMYLLIAFVQLDSTPGLPTSFIRFNEGW